jgi:hypothetical protein
MPTYCDGCDAMLSPEDVVIDPLTRDQALKCAKCGWRSDQQETRGQLGPELEMEAVA